MSRLLQMQMQSHLRSYATSHAALSCIRRSSSALSSAFIQQQRRCIHSFSSAHHSTSSTSSPLPPIHVLRLDHLRLSIHSQLRIEEALLRSPQTKSHTYFLLNQPPAHEKSIVLGIGNKTELLVHLEKAEQDGIQLIRRFSGGGTVFIDKNCWMVTMIVNKEETDDTSAATSSSSSASSSSSSSSPSPTSSSSPLNSTSSIPPLVHPSTVQCFPSNLMAWTKDFYEPVFSAASSSPSSSPPTFSLTGSDYCFSSRKFGGNAQTITRRRWLHHTSFLWSLDGLQSIEKYLKNPKKQPEYRKGRGHDEFLVSLKEVWKDVQPMQMEGIEQGQQQDAFEQTNTPSQNELFRSAPSSFTDVNLLDDLITDSEDEIIPASLPARLLWRLSHFFTLVYPTLDEIAAIVHEYERSSAGSSIKLLDYQMERKRIEEEEAKASEKARAEQEQAQIQALRQAVR